MAVNKIYLTAKTVDEAISKGLAELNASLSDISFKVINEGGIFSKAKIEMWLDEKETEIIEKKPEEKPAEIKKIKINVDDEANDNTDNKKTVSANFEKKSFTENGEKRTFSETGEKREPSVKLTEEQTEAVILQAQTYLQKIVSFTDTEATVEKKEDDTSVNFDVQGKKLSAVIGNGGETLNALQLLLNVYAGKNRGFRKRIYIDAGNYKSGKDKELIELAQSTADKVRQTGESVKLRPLSAYERRVVHAALAECEDVMTKSIGEEPNRNLFVLPKMKI